MAITNYLVQVQTYQNSGLAYLENVNCFISNANKKFQGFNDFTGNLGSTVQMEYTANINLVSGTYYIFVETDPGESIDETNESNNVTSPVAVNVLCLLLS